MREVVGVMDGPAATDGAAVEEEGCDAIGGGGGSLEQEPLKAGGQAEAEQGLVPAATDVDTVTGVDVVMEPAQVKADEDLTTGLATHGTSAAVPTDGATAAPAEQSPPEPTAGAVLDVAGEAGAREGRASALHARSAAAADVLPSTEGYALTARQRQAHREGIDWDNTPQLSSRVVRCAVCIVQKKGACGTATAPSKCLRRLALEQAGLPLRKLVKQAAQKGDATTESNVVDSNGGSEPPAREAVRPSEEALSRVAGLIAVAQPELAPLLDALKAGVPPPAQEEPDFPPPPPPPRAPAARTLDLRSAAVSELMAAARRSAPVDPTRDFSGGRSVFPVPPHLAEASRELTREAADGRRASSRRKGEHPSIAAFKAKRPRIRGEAASASVKPKPKPKQPKPSPKPSPKLAPPLPAMPVPSSEALDTLRDAAAGRGVGRVLLATGPANDTGVASVAAWLAAVAQRKRQRDGVAPMEH